MNDVIIDNKKVGKFKIGIYELKQVGGYDKIVISQVTALTEEGEYIKHCKLNSVINYLNQYPVEFRRAGNDVK
jgi:hypothetical protein